MSTDYTDEWETSSGLSLDGAKATIIDMSFGFNNNIGAGVTCANLTLEIEENGEVVEQSFSVGGRNEASRDGTVLQGTAKINKRSNFGLLIESIKDVVDNPAETIGRVREVSGWIGTTWTWGTIDIETTNPNTGETKVSSKFIVTEYHGRADGEPKAKGEGKGEAKGEGKSKAKKAKGDDITDHPLWGDLVMMAAEHDDHDDFVDEALDLDGVEGDKAITRAIMGDGEGSVWAAAKEG